MRARTIFSVSSILWAALFAVSAAGQVSAEDFPSKEIHYILHASPGGGTDVMARTLAPEAEEALGQPVVVGNRTGGGGAVQLTYLTRSAEPDGYTIGAVTGTHIARFHTAFAGQFNIDSVDWISGLLAEPFIFVVHADSDMHTLEDMVEAIKADPEQLRIASFAVGGAQHVGWHIFADGAGFNADDAIWVPYDSIGEAATATLGKHAEICVCFVTQVRDHVRAGDLRVLAVLADQRLDTFPDVPTVVEAGYPDVETGWMQFRGIIAPKGIPADRKEKLHDAFMQALETERVQTWMDANALVTLGLGPEEFTQFVQRYDALAETWLKRLGIAQ